MGTFLSKFITISLTSLTWSVLACLIRAFLAFLLAAEVMAFKNIFCLRILSISIFFAYSTRGSIPCGCITVFLYVLVFRDSFWSSPPPPPPPLPPATRRPPPAIHLLADGDPMTGVTTHFFLSLFFFDTRLCILHSSIDELWSTRRRSNSPTPTCRRIKSSRDISELFLNPIQLIKS